MCEDVRRCGAPGEGAGALAGGERHTRQVGAGLFTLYMARRVTTTRGIGGAPGAGASYGAPGGMRLGETWYRRACSSSSRLLLSVCLKLIVGRSAEGAAALNGF